MNFKEWCLERQRLEREFKRTFHFDLPYDETKLFADIIAIDERIKTPDDVSMSDWVKQNYGEEADKLLDDLINLMDMLPLETKEEEPKGLLRAAKRMKV